MPPRAPGSPPRERAGKGVVITGATPRFPAGRWPCATAAWRAVRIVSWPPYPSPGSFARSNCGLPLTLAKQQRFVGQFQRGPDVSAVWTAVTCKIKYCARRGYVDVVNAGSDQCHLTQPSFTTSRTLATKPLSNLVPRPPSTGRPATGAASRSMTVTGTARRAN